MRQPLLQVSDSPNGCGVRSSYPALGLEPAAGEGDAIAVHGRHLDADMVIPLQAVGGLVGRELALEGAERGAELDQDAVREGLHDGGPVGRIGVGGEVREGLGPLTASTGRHAEPDVDVAVTVDVGLDHLGFHLGADLDVGDVGIALLAVASRSLADVHQGVATRGRTVGDLHEEAVVLLAHDRTGHGLTSFAVGAGQGEDALDLVALFGGSQGEADLEVALLARLHLDGLGRDLIAGLVAGDLGVALFAARPGHLGGVEQADEAGGDALGDVHQDVVAPHLLDHARHHRAALVGGAADDVLHDIAVLDDLLGDRDAMAVVGVTVLRGTNRGDLDGDLVTFLQALETNLPVVVAAAAELLGVAERRRSVVAELDEHAEVQLLADGGRQDLTDDDAVDLGDLVRLGRLGDDLGGLDDDRGGLDGDLGGFDDDGGGGIGHAGVLFGGGDGSAGGLDLAAQGLDRPAVADAEARELQLLDLGDEERTLLVIGIDDVGGGSGLGLASLVRDGGHGLPGVGVTAGLDESSLQRDAQGAQFGGGVGVLRHDLNLR